MGVAMSDETHGPSNAEVVDLLKRTLSTLERSIQEQAERPSRADFARLEASLNALEKTIRGDSDGLVLRMDRLEQKAPFDPDAFQTSLMAKVDEKIANAMKLTPAQVWTILAAVAAGLLWLFEKVVTP